MKTSPGQRPHHPSARPADPSRTDPRPTDFRPTDFRPAPARQLPGLRIALLAPLALGLLAGCGGSSSPAAPAPSGSVPSGSAAPVSSSATPTPRAQPTSSPTSARTMVHTGLRGTGTWTTTTLRVPPARRTAQLYRYTVQAEGGTGIDVNAAARQISGILNDPRSWSGYQGTSFELVPGTAGADFVIHLASPATATRMCQPLDVAMTLSCSEGPKVVLNTDRWLYGIPAYRDLDLYRSYVVNHEVGHFIGKGHVQCPGKGRKAPVMMQQTKGVGECVANPWPVDDGK